MIRQVAVAASIALLGLSGQAVAAQTGQAANAKLTASDCATIADGSMKTVSSVSCGSALTKAQYTEGEGTYDGVEGTFYRSNDLWLFLGFGLLTAVVVGAAMSDDEEPASP